MRGVDPRSGELRWTLAVLSACGGPSQWRVVVDPRSAQRLWWTLAVASCGGPSQCSVLVVDPRIRSGEFLLFAGETLAVVFCLLEATAK